MKKLFIILLFAVLLVGTISAFDFDNVKSYNSTTDTITVINAFSLGDTIAEIQLKTPHDNKVALGYQKVAEMEFTSYLDFKSYLANSNFELIDLRTGTGITRNLDFKYLTTEDVKVNDSQIIQTGSYPNGTAIYGSQVVGSHIEQKQVWKDLIDYVYVEGQPVTIGVFTNVQDKDKVEWIPTFYGVTITEWATWTASLETSIDSWWALNETSGVVVDIPGTNDGTNNGATRGLSGVSSITNNSFNFTGADYVNVTGFHLEDNSSINLWVKLWSLSDTQTLLSRWKDGFNRDWELQINPTSGNIVLFYKVSTVTKSFVTSTTALNDKAWHMVTYVRNNTDENIYIDGSLINTDVHQGSIDNTQAETWFGARLNPGNYLKAQLDEIANWNRDLTPSEITTLYNDADGCTWQRCDVDSLSVILTSPENNTNFTTNLINLLANVSSTEGISITNVSLCLDGNCSKQTNSSGFEGLYNFSETLSDGDYNWTVIAYGNDSVQYNAVNGTLLFSVDGNAPTINVSYPNETITFHQANTNLTLNWSVNDTHISTCLFDWNSVNTTVTCADNTTSFNVTNASAKSLTFYANDTFGNIASQVVTWDYRLFLNYEIYDASLLESVPTTFSANFLTNGSSISQANLSYNNTENLGTINNHGGNNFTVTKSISTPSVVADTNISFYWNISQGSLYYNLTPKNQTVLNIAIDDCSVNSNVLYNFTIVDEKHQTTLTAVGNNTLATIDAQFYPFGSTTKVAQYNNSFAQINPFTICFNSTSGLNLTADSQVQYSANNYQMELYHIQNSTINSTNFPTNITLYDLNSSDAQVFTIKFKDSSFLPVPDALVEIQRKYIDEAVFKVVEIPKTNSKGESLANLVLNDVVYNIVVKKYGVNLGSITNVLAVCQNPAITTCTIDFNAFVTGVNVPDFEAGEDFNFTLGYDNSTRIISSTFVIPSGTTSTVSLNVTREDALGTAVCTDILTSTSGTLSCTVPTSFGNSTIRAKLYRDSNLQAQGSVKLNQNPYEIYGVITIALALFVMLTLIGAGISDNPVFTVLWFMLGVILLFALNLVANNGFIGSSATILWLIVAIVIVVIKIGRRT